AAAARQALAARPALLATRAPLEMAGGRLAGAVLLGVRGLFAVGQPVVDSLARDWLLRGSVCRRWLFPPRRLLQVRLPDRPVSLRECARRADRGACSRRESVPELRNEGLYPRQRRDPRLRTGPVRAAQGRQHGLHLLPRLRPRLSARQHWADRGAS